MEVTTVDNTQDRVIMERSLIHLGVKLISNRSKYENGKDVIDEFKLILK